MSNIKIKALKPSPEVCAALGEILIETVANVMDVPFEKLCEVTGDRLGQDSRYWLDSSAIRRDVGWTPEIGLEAGIREMVQWGRTYLDQLRDWPMDYTLRA